MARPSDNIVGAAFMVAAMALFALEDMFFKAAATEMPVGQILTIFGLTGTLVFSVVARLQGDPVLHPWMISRSMLVRAGFESGGRLFYTLAIGLTPLSNATTILQATPLVVVAGAALVLGESVGWRRWLAVWAGFGGVLMILRPGMAGWDATAILAILGMLGFAGRDLATRAAPKGLTTAQLGICGFYVLVPSGLLLLAGTGGATIPGPVGLTNLSLGMAIGFAAYAALTRAMRTGAVSVVTPFRYSRLLFGVGLGVIVFGERPDAMTMLGSIVILLSGLYIMLLPRLARRAG